MQEDKKRKMLKIILIRHAESIANALGITQGQKIDEPLSKKGKYQALKLVHRLKNEGVGKIYSSDLKRALHTAKKLSKTLKINIISDKRLRERNHESETNEGFVGRCKSFLQDIKKQQGTILVVAHGGTNRTILAISTGNRKKGAEVYNMTKQENACINVIDFKNNKWTIKTVNDLSHLTR